MKKALLVARWEFLATVKRPIYFIMVAAMPAFYGLMFVLAGLAGRSATSSAGRIPTAVVDSAHILDLDVAAAQAARRGQPSGSAVAGAASSAVTGAARGAISGSADGSMGTSAATSAAAAFTAATPASALASYATVDDAVAALAQGKAAAVFVIDPDFLANGTLTAYSKDNGIFAMQGDQRRQGQVADAIRASLMHRSMPEADAARAYAPAEHVTRLHVTSQGTVEAINDPYGLGPFAGSLGLVLLLSLSIFLSAGFLQQATIADRQNRMFEVLLSSLDSNELLAGKLLGFGAAGLLQVAIYVALIIVPGTTLLSLFQVPIARLLLSLTYYVIGYALFACLMTGTGMLGRSAQEAAQLSALWTMFSASPFFFLANIGTAPNGPLARGLSFFPLTSPVTMMMRLGGADVPTLDVVLSLGIDVLAIAVVTRGASKIFRASTLMQGKRATLGEFLRWLKAA